MSDKKTNIIILDRLRKTLERIGNTNEEIAKVLECDHSTVNKWYNGNLTPSFEKIVKICKQANVSIDYLCGLRNEATNNEKISDICDYTGLSKETIEFFSFYHLRCKDKNFMKEFIDFIEFFISTVEEEYSFAIDISDLIRNTNNYKECLANVVEKFDLTKEITGDSIVSPVPIELEDIILIKNAQKDINASKYTLSEYFKSVIDDFILSKVKNTDNYDLAILEHKFYKSVYSEDI